MELKYEFYIGAATEQVWEILVTPEGTRKIFLAVSCNRLFKWGNRSNM